MTTQYTSPRKETAPVMKPEVKLWRASSLFNERMRGIRAIKATGNKEKGG